jgi:hypothetical protein
VHGRGAARGLRHAIGKGASSPTFCVAGHHYALVVLEDLEPGSTLPYTVALDGGHVWPAGRRPVPAVRHPDPRARTRRAAHAGLRLLPGQRPARPPYSRRKDDDDRGREVDALLALVERLRHQPPEAWPDALLLLGDQVYADEVSPRTQELIDARRPEGEGPPRGEVGDFEEYCALYRESWSDPALRWLLSTVSTAMIFDDHDVHDDWNTSQAWVEAMRAKPWWEDRIVGAYMSYWIYQHLGTCPPTTARGPRVLRRHDGGDQEAEVREFARSRAARSPRRAGASVATSGAPGCSCSTPARARARARAAPDALRRRVGVGPRAGRRATTTTC